MRTVNRSRHVLLVASVGFCMGACGKSGGGTGAGGTPGLGGRGFAGGAPGAAGTSGTGGVPGSGGNPASGGMPGNGGGTGTGGSVPSGADCTVADWPTADPAVAGPFATVTEQNVGPVAGVAVDGGAPPQFTLFRPADLAQGGLCHPIVTWGNGTGATPSMYGVLLTRLASHGFVVIASNSTNVGQGNPAPMVAGVTWVLQQNDDPTSVMYHRIDTTHVGATGHSQGGFATTTAGADSHITTIAPLCGASAQRNLHGPAILLCGGNDTNVPCDGTIKTAFDGINNQPIMLADYLSADHASWITFRGTTLSPMEIAVVAWMRVHLMGDSALRPRFYGADCALCQDSAWKITQKQMDP
jgi:dienelactone hydrolase